MCSYSEAFHSLRACAVLVVGVAGTMPIHSMGTACFIVTVDGIEHILEVHNCLLCHGEDDFNLLSVSQLLRDGQNEVVFSKDASRLVIKGSAGSSTSIDLKENEGLYELRVSPLCIGDDRKVLLPRLVATQDDDLRLWAVDPQAPEYVGMRSPTKLGVWYCRMLWTSCRVGLQGIKSAEYEDNLREFCDSYFVPPSQPPARKTYRTTDIEDMADLSLRFMGVGTDRLKHTLARSRGLSPLTKKKGENVSVVPPLNFPQGKWKAGKTPRVSKNKVKNLHRASIGEVCFTDTFETDDNHYKYGQAVVDYRSRYGDIIPIRSRKKVGWAFAEFCCRHFTPLILIRDDIAENMGGDLMEECRRRGIKSAFSCPYKPQQDYAEGYLGRVKAMASFAMVFSGAPLFMWRWAIICAAFINNITATFYKLEGIWATPWELVHGEPFPDSSIVIPFGCAVLVLLNKQERETFMGTCAMMIFIHYALDHPLYTFAVYSPRTKRVLYRQDVVFLPHVFPMRAARVRGGFDPDGEGLVAYRPPQVPGVQVEEGTSFGTWTPDDPLPSFQDHITGYPLVSPSDSTSLTSEARPSTWPTWQPKHPAFGDRSVVKVPLPWTKEQGAPAKETSNQEGSRMEVAESRPKRRVRLVGEDSTSGDVEKIGDAPKRRPVKERWFYEPLPEQQQEQPTLLGVPNVLALPSHDDRATGEQQDIPAAQGGIRSGERETSSRDIGERDKNKEGHKSLVDVTNLSEELLFDEIVGQSNVWKSGQSDVTKENPDDRGKLEDETSVLLQQEPDIRGRDFVRYQVLFSHEHNECNVNPTSMSMLDSVTLSTLGPTEPISSKELDEAGDNEVTACALQGMVFLDDQLGWCMVTNWGVDFGTNIIYYAPVATDNLGDDEHHASLSEVLAWIRQVPVVHRISEYRSSRRLSGLSCKKAGLIRILSAKQACAKWGTMHVRAIGDACSKIKFLPARVMRRIFKAQETLFKYGTLIPKSDREAELSPEAIRWKSGRQLEWLRLRAAKTFETHWTWKMIQKIYPDYKKSEIGHMFYIYDYKYSGEHRVRLVFDGSRQSPNTYSITYAPTVRSESVRLFHLYAVEYGWSIQQFDVPQAFLRSDADCTIFVHPPKGQSDFPGQILKLFKMLYGSKQAAALWYNLLNTFLHKIGFVASSMDPCFYRRPCIPGTDPTEPRSDAIIILHVDDMRVAATPAVLKVIHDLLFTEFQITTSDSGRFLGMDTEYDIQHGVFKMHMATYIQSTVDRFANFDLTRGIPYRELVGSLLWIVLCVMGTELLRVKDLARRSNNYTIEDYQEAMVELNRIFEQRSYGIIFRRGGAGREYVPASTRLGGGRNDSDLDEGYSIGDVADINELEESHLYKLDPHVDDASLDIEKKLADTNPRFTVVAYTDASFAVGETKQSISGFDVMINGVPILWGSLKQTIVVDSTCSSEYVAASVCCKQVIQAENMVQFLDFSCPRPHRMYTDSQACLKIATTASKLGMVRHLEIRYHLVRCIVLSGSVALFYCITEEMLADLFTKIVTSAQDKRLAVRFYNDCIME